MKLFAVFIGGRHPKANVELHDMRFVVGETLKDTYKDLKASWWGTPSTLHIDGYAELSGFSGHRIEVIKAKADEPSAENQPRLYFINVGYYDASNFGEQHAYSFRIGRSKAEMWRTANTDVGDMHAKHQDNFMAVDEVIDVTETLFTSGYSIRLVPDETMNSAAPELISDYIKMPV